MWSLGIGYILNDNEIIIHGYINNAVHLYKDTIESPNRL